MAISQNSPLISILMPVKNTEEYLRNCLDSILVQSYTHWELLAVDDNSTDQSGDILSKYEEKDSRIVKLKNSKNGIIPALETAYANSKGALIHRMDSDDLMPEHKLAALYKALRENPSGIATGKVKYFSDRGMKDGYLAYEKWLNEVMEKEGHYEEIYFECTLPSPAWLMHRKTLLSIGGICSGWYPEDYDLAFRAYQNNIPILPSENIVHLWRDHPDRSSRTLEQYSDPRFFDLKMHHFMEKDRDESRRLILWGAGRNGKDLMHSLSKHVPDFLWIDGNSNRIGQNIRGKKIYKIDEIVEGDQIVLAIATINAKREISVALEARGFLKNRDFFPFV